MVDEGVSRSLEEIREELQTARTVLDPTSMQEGGPNIQTQSTTLMYDLSSSGSATAYKDYKGYMNSSSEGYGLLETEMDKLSKLDGLSESGKDYTHMLYCYRPVSRALPEVVINASDDHSAKQLRDMERKRSEINRKVIEIMRPEIMKLNDLFSFTIKAVEQLRASFHDFLQYFVGAGKKGDAVPDSMPFLNNVRRESQYASIVRLIDILIILDYLKYAKSASLSEDFDRYKRALRSQAHGRDVVEEQVQLQHFLSHQNTRKRKHFIFQYLCDELHRPYPNTSRGPHAALRNVLFYVVEQLDEKRYATPDEKYRLLRVMAHLVVLIDYKEGDHAMGEDEKRKGGKNKFKLEPEDDVFDAWQEDYYENVRRYFQEYPVVPLFGDVTLTMVYALDLSPRFDLENTAQGDSWGKNPDDRVIVNYDLESNWEALRDTYTEYNIQFTTFYNRVKDPSVLEELDTSILDGETLATAEAAYKLVRLGLSHALHMTCLVHQMLAWKYSHPCPESKLEELGVDPNAEGTEYERVLRYNLSHRQLSVLADVVAMVKSLSGMIIKAEPVFAPLIRYHVHHLLQQMVQGDLLPIIHRADKRKLSFLPSLLHLRSLVADWNGEEPVEDYKHYKRRQGNVTAGEHTARVVGPSRTQLHLLQCHLSALFTDDIVTKTTRGVLTRKKPDIDEGDVAKFRVLLQESYCFPRVLSFGHVLRSCADMGLFWYREFYLEKTHCIQFPIEMSLPWILTEHVVTNVQTAGVTHGPPLVENALFMLDLYNDAANLALHTLHQQHLYNEIEAEAALVLDQVVFALSTEMYDYFKNVAASSHLDKHYKGKLEELKGYSYLTMLARRIHTPLAQRNVQLLGRAVDLNFLLGRHLNDKIRRDIDTAIQRFEASDCAAIVELQAFMELMRSVHKAVSTEVDIDSFEEILDECNESFNPSLKLQGRIMNQFLFSLLEDVLPNFCYNNVTERFVSAPIALQPVAYGNMPRKAAVEQLYGPACAKAYDMYGRLTRGFVGKEHIEAFLAVAGRENVPRLKDECLKLIQERLRKLALYVTALLDHLPVAHQLDKDLSEHTTQEYRRLHTTFGELLDFDDLKPEVFQSFREIGNAVVFLRNLSEVMEIRGQSEFMNLSPLLGLVPDSKQTDKRLYQKHAPVMKAYKRLASAVDRSVVKDLPVSANSVFEIVFAANSQPGPDSADAGLFAGVMERVKELFHNLDLYTRWAPSHSQSATTLAANSENKSFFRLWSALVFLFCVEDLPSEGEEDRKDVEIEVSNEEEFGHGFAVAGALVLHLLRQKHAFHLSDHATHMLKVITGTRAKYSLAFAKQDITEKLDAHMISEEGLDHDDDGNLPEEVSHFIENARSVCELHEEYFDFFEANVPADRASGEHKSEGESSQHQLKVFHPPRSEM